jgi:hypothetical protein
LFGVSQSQHHLEELVMAHVPPPPLNEEATKVRPGIEFLPYHFS